MHPDKNKAPGSTEAFKGNTRSYCNYADDYDSVHVLDICVYKEVSFHENIDCGYALKALKWCASNG